LQHTQFHHSKHVCTCSAYTHTHYLSLLCLLNRCSVVNHVRLRTERASVCSTHSSITASTSARAVHTHTHTHTHHLSLLCLLNRCSVVSHVRLRTERASVCSTHSSITASTSARAVHTHTHTHTHHLSLLCLLNRCSVVSYVQLCTERASVCSTHSSITASASARAAHTHTHTHHLSLLCLLNRCSVVSYVRLRTERASVCSTHSSITASTAARAVHTHTHTHTHHLSLLCLLNRCSVVSYVRLRTERASVCSTHSSITASASARAAHTHTHTHTSSEPVVFA